MAPSGGSIKISDCFIPPDWFMLRWINTFVCLSLWSNVIKCERIVNYYFKEIKHSDFSKKARFESCNKIPVWCISNIWGFFINSFVGNGLKKVQLNQKESHHNSCLFHIEGPRKSPEWSRIMTITQLQQKRSYGGAMKNWWCHYHLHRTSTLAQGRAVAPDCSDPHRACCCCTDTQQIAENMRAHRKKQPPWG